MVIQRFLGSQKDPSDPEFMESPRARYSCFTGKDTHSPSASSLTRLDPSGMAFWTSSSEKVESATSFRSMSTYGSRGAIPSGRNRTR